jgi:hypothetical protein
MLAGADDVMCTEAKERVRTSKKTKKGIVFSVVNELKKKIGRGC